MDDSQTSAARRINLSYILHEPSRSAPVTQHLVLVEREEKRLARLTSQLGALANNQLNQRVVRRDRVAAPHDPAPESVVLLTLRLGAWTLVERLFRVTDASGRYQGVPSLNQTIDATSGVQGTVTLFREAARLIIPEEPVPHDSEIWLVFAPVRPGTSSLHLETMFLGKSTAEESLEWLQAAIPWLETILREHPTQWFADRPLWLAPVESSRPEFKHGAGHD